MLIVYRPAFLYDMLLKFYDDDVDDDMMTMKLNFNIFNMATYSISLYINSFKFNTLCVAGMHSLLNFTPLYII